LPPTLPRPRPWRTALALVTGVLSAHALLLDLWSPGPGAGAPGDTARPLQVRQIASPAPPAPRRPPAAPHPDTRAAAPGATAQRPAPTPLPQSSAAAVAQPSGGAAVPVYATRLPPPATLHYVLRRGRANGQAELQWRPDATRYALTLHGELPGTTLASASEGGFDAAGIAPERHTESRRGRELRAANFQRGAARVTFSGPAVEYPIVPGAQDRLSWMIQLGAVLAANPALAAPGAEVRLFVVGTRGDGEVWTFSVIERGAIELPAGGVAAAVHLLREPQRRYDTQVDVWLDPARHHLPVRTRLLVLASGEGSEWLLDGIELP
jgi:hypothetical protein